MLKLIFTDNSDKRFNAASSADLVQQMNAASLFANAPTDAAYMQGAANAARLQTGGAIIRYTDPSIFVADLVEAQLLNCEGTTAHLVSKTQIRWIFKDFGIAVKVHKSTAKGEVDLLFDADSVKDCKAEDRNSCLVIKNKFFRHLCENIFPYGSYKDYRYQKTQLRKLPNKAELVEIAKAYNDGFLPLPDSPKYQTNHHSHYSPTSTWRIVTDGMQRYATLNDHNGVRILTVYKEGAYDCTLPSKNNQAAIRKAKDLGYNIYPMPNASAQA